MPVALRRCCLFLIAACWCLPTHAQEEAGPLRGEDLLPRETKGFASVGDVNGLIEHWDQTGLGRLFADEAMQPFVGDIQQQFDSRLGTTGIRTGIGLSDLRDVCSGEICVGVIQPKDKTQKHAIAVLAYVQGRDEAVSTLLKKVDKTMTDRQAKRENVTLGEVKAISYDVPIKKGGIKTFKTYIFVHKDWLVATDHPDTATGIVKNLDNLAEGISLADVDAFQATMDRCQKDAGDVEPEVRWFVEPLGYSEVARAATSNKKKRRTDLIGALRNQGFEAVRGIGGFVNLMQDHREFVHRFFIYAPPLDDNPEKYELAARMLAFPLAGDMTAPGWVPSSVSSYVSATWDLQGAYQYIGSLIDEVAGDEGFFEDLKDSLETDPNGPQINLDKEVVAYLGNQATVITDCQVPIEPTSERFLVAIDLNNPEQMGISLEKALGSDPNVKQLEIDGHIVWEIINEEEEYPEFDIEVDGFGMDSGFEEEEEFDPLLSSAAISIVKGKFIISSHVDFVADIMRFEDGDPKLLDDADYQTMMAELEALGAGEDCARMFSRIDEEVHTSYTLLREGRMPESQGLIGQILNRALASEEDEDEMREQELDADQLPEFQVVRRYLGTMGNFLQTEENGWFVAGLGLPKGARYLEAAGEGETVITTAAADSGADSQ